MRCRLCGSGSFTNIFNDVKCDRCGAIYDMETLELKGFHRDEVLGLIDKIKNEELKAFIKGMVEYWLDIQSIDEPNRRYAIRRLEEVVISLIKMEG